jgi:hypothetical protein
MWKRLVAAAMSFARKEQGTPPSGIQPSAWDWSPCSTPLNAFERSLVELYEQLSESNLHELVRLSTTIIEDRIKSEFKTAEEARLRRLRELASWERPENKRERRGFYSFRSIEERDKAASISEALKAVFAQLAELIIKKDPDVVPDLSEAISTFLRLSGKSLGAAGLKMVIDQKQASSAFYDLRDFARSDLKGKQRRIVELLCDNDGEVPLAILASDPAIRWKKPWDNSYGKAQGQIRLKLRAANIRFYLSRVDNSATLRTLPKKA